ncbi:MAG: SPOR domain-containing protein [Holosporales bacterium]|jgi:cell division septation protein DedD|nr:SPOR domain-containing protein [Holosporales bacterium]
MRFFFLEEKNSYFSDTLENDKDPWDSSSVDFLKGEKTKKNSFSDLPIEATEKNNFLEHNTLFPELKASKSSAILKKSSPKLTKKEGKLKEKQNYDPFSEWINGSLKNRKEPQVFIPTIQPSPKVTEESIHKEILPPPLPSSHDCILPSTGFSDNNNYNYNRLSKPIFSGKFEGASEAQNRSMLNIHEGHLGGSQIPPKPHEDSSIEATNKFPEEIELRKKPIELRKSNKLSLATSPYLNNTSYSQQKYKETTTWPLKNLGQEPQPFKIDLKQRLLDFSFDEENKKSVNNNNAQAEVLNEQIRDFKNLKLDPPEKVVPIINPKEQKKSSFQKAQAISEPYKINGILKAKIIFSSFLLSSIICGIIFLKVYNGVSTSNNDELIVIKTPSKIKVKPEKSEMQLVPYQDELIYGKLDHNEEKEKSEEHILPTTNFAPNIPTDEEKGEDEGEGEEKKEEVESDEYLDYSNKSSKKENLKKYLEKKEEEKIKVKTPPPFLNNSLEGKPLTTNNTVEKKTLIKKEKSASKIKKRGEKTEKNNVSPKKLFYVQLGIFTSKQEANKEILNLRKKHTILSKYNINVRFEKHPNGQVYYKVLVGPFKNNAEANTLQSVLGK